MNQSNEMGKRTVTIKRTFNAPLKLVWEAWTRPEHIAHWWGPKGMETKVLEHDFRVGGKWKFTMEMPDGNEFLSEGTYSEIVELEKIISSADFKPMTEGVQIHALFEENGNQTTMHWDVDFEISEENEAAFPEIKKNIEGIYQMAAVSLAEYANA